MNPELIAEAILGRDAEDFWKTELGRYILGRLKQEREVAVDALIAVQPMDERKIRELQNELWRIDTVKGWFSELIMSGKQAEVALNEPTET